MPVARRRLALVLAGVVIVVAVIVQITRSRCTSGTFSYVVAVENPTSQEDWRADAAVLVEGEERVVTDDHATLDVALSPDGKQVVVAKGRGPTNDEFAGVDPIGLYTYDVDGSNEQRLAEDTTGSEPDWSPDGARVVYLSGRTIRTVDVDDNEEREVYRLPPARGSDPDYLLDVTWSGDSERIAFIVGRPIPNDGILWTMRADGSELRRVTNIGVVYADLVWSPGGDKFAWEGAYKGIPSVMIVDGGGGEPRQVEPFSYDPVWSRDGDELAYVIGHEGHYTPRIVVGDAEGRDERPVAVPDDARGGTSMTDWASC